MNRLSDVLKEYEQLQRENDLIPYIEEVRSKPKMYEVGIDSAQFGRTRTGYLYDNGTRISEDGPIYFDWQLIFDDSTQYDITCTEYDSNPIRIRTLEMVIDNAISRGLAYRGNIHMPVEDYGSILSTRIAVKTP